MIVWRAGRTPHTSGGPQLELTYVSSEGRFNASVNPPFSRCFIASPPVQLTTNHGEAYSRVRQLF